MIDTWSGFTYDFRVNAQPYNGFINIDEGAGELTISLPVGSYTLGTLVDAIRVAFLTQATLDYQVLLDRNTRRITISATNNFSLLTSSGSNSFLNALALAGFDDTNDFTGSNTYTSNVQAGDVYLPQFRLQNYIPPELFQVIS